MINVGYLRLSKEDGDDESSSITNQRRILLEYADNNNITIDKFYIDDGVSGWTMDRPEFNKLKNDLNNNEIHTVIVKDLSRLGRHNAKVSLFLDNMLEDDKRVIAINDNYDTDKPETHDMVGIKTWMNERYIKETSNKIRKSISALQKEGKWICSVPYGYVKDSLDKTKYHVDPLTAPYIKMIYDMYISGMGIKFIARELTERGIPTPSMVKKQQKESKGQVCHLKTSSNWDVSTINRVLKDEFYIGTLVLGKAKIKGINGKKVSTPEEDRYVFKDAHEPIIDAATFNLVQDIMKDRSFGHYRGKKSQVRDNIFSGILYCADCGKRLTSSGSCNNGTDTRYICYNYNIYGTKVCTSHALSENELKEVLIEFLEHCKVNLSNIIDDVNNIIQSELKTKSNSNNNIAQLTKMLEDAKNSLKVLIEQKMRETMKNPSMADMIDNMYSEMQTAKYDEIKSLEKQLFTQQEIALDEVETKKSLNTALSIINDVIYTKKLTKKQVLMLVDKITVYENGGVDIYLKGNLHDICNNYFKITENKLNKVRKHLYDYIVDHQEKFVANDCTTYIREQGVKLTHRTITKELKELRDSGLIEIRPMNRGFKLSGSIQDLECKLLNNNVVGTGRWWRNNNDKIELLIKVNSWIKRVMSGNTKKHLF